MKRGKMFKLINNQKVSQFFIATKPYLVALVAVALLSYTNILREVSVLTGSLIMKTGLMNAPVEIDDAASTFDYDFVIKDMEGNNVDVKQFKGKVVFLNLWATWCGPCRMEMPSIQELYAASDRSKVVFIMLSLDDAENHNKVIKYINDKGYTFPVYETLGYLPRQLRVNTIPTTFIIGTDGKVKTKKVGAANYNTDEFKNFLLELAQ